MKTSAALLQDYTNILLLKEYIYFFVSEIFAKSDCIVGRTRAVIYSIFFYLSREIEAYLKYFDPRND